LEFPIWRTDDDVAVRSRSKRGCGFLPFQFSGSSGGHDRFEILGVEGDEKNGLLRIGGEIKGGGRLCCEARGVTLHRIDHRILAVGGR